MLAEALTKGSELADLLPEDYKQQHLRIAALINKIGSDETLSSAEESELTTELGMAMEDISQHLFGGQHGTAIPDDDAPPGPTIICSTLVGAKGLSAGHVFVVGMNDGHFPVDPRTISNDEVCKLIVALSRTRKCCHLVSARRFGAEWLNESRFIAWLNPFCEKHTIDATHWSASAAAAARK